MLNWTRIKRRWNSIEDTRALKNFFIIITWASPQPGVTIKLAKTISVVIPTYNRAEYLRQALDGVLAQTFKDYDIIVVDDNSTDGTKELVASYGANVRYICQENKERGAGRNNGVKNSESEYIAFLDSDDMWLSNHLEVCLEALKQDRDAGLSFSGSYIVDENGNIISKMGLRPFNGYVLRDIVAAYSSGGCNASSCLIRKKVFDRAGYFSEDRDLSGSEDWEMWARLSSYTKFVWTGKYTAKIRFHTLKSSINADKMAKSMKMALDLLYDNSDISPKIEDLRDRAYSRLYTVTAINYYAAGDMGTARRYIKEAVKIHPASLFTNRYIMYTFLRSLLGRGITSKIRAAKWSLGGKFIR
jgi:glycosyltransferase involved in cell wall biosynthesis